MDKLQRAWILSWVMPLVSPMGGVGVIWLATVQWHVAAYALYVACMFVAVVYGASRDPWGQGDGDG